MNEKLKEFYAQNFPGIYNGLRNIDIIMFHVTIGYYIRKVDRVENVSDVLNLQLNLINRRTDYKVFLFSYSGLDFNRFTQINNSFRSLTYFNAYLGEYIRRDELPIEDLIKQINLIRDSYGE